jgi:hypothetical protein
MKQVADAGTKPGDDLAYAARIKAAMAEVHEAVKAAETAGLQVDWYMNRWDTGFGSRLQDYLSVRKVMTYV